MARLGPDPALSNAIAALRAAEAGGSKPTAPDAPVPVDAHNAAPSTRPGDHEPTARRITAIHLPRLAIERWTTWAQRQGEVVTDDTPVALATDGPHGAVIHATNRAAEGEGIHPGARVVDMRALCPGLRVEFADLQGDAMMLQRLMLWTRRWCPWTAVDGADGLILDTTGSDHLWGGEAAMLRDMEARFSGLGLTAGLACAPTRGAAWALARHGGVRPVCGPGDLDRLLAPLPARSLRLDADTILLLKRLGLKTVGDLMAMPRLSLARRFSRAPLPQNPLLRLDQMTGRLAEPVTPPEDPPRFCVSQRLPEPVEDPVPLLPGLCAALCDRLERAGLGARSLCLTLYRTDGQTIEIRLATARASRDAAHLARLFDGRLDGIDPGFGIDLVTLAAPLTGSLAPRQARLDTTQETDADLARMIDRLTARLGPGAVRAPTFRDSHIPERREAWHPGATDTAPLPARGDRPLRLFDTPEEVRVLYAVPDGPPAQFVWRRVTHRVIRFAGPERIAPEWWADRLGIRLRDYYRVEDHLGGRFWVYRDGVLGDARGGEPRWFVHGVFS